MIELVYNRTKEDVVNRTDIGHYNYTDLNRVGEAYVYIAEMLTEYGYAVPDNLPVDWTETDLPKTSDMDEYIQHIRCICGKLVYMDDPPELPITMERLTFLGANNIEKNLQVLGRMAENIPAAWFQCGMTEAGVIYQ